MKRLSGWDAVLLYSETPNVHMHTIKVAVIELRRRRSGLRHRRRSARSSHGRLYKLEPFCYQLVDIPFKFHHPMWRENCEVDLDYHIRPLAAARPGRSPRARRGDRRDRQHPAGPQPSAVGDVLRRGPGQQPDRGGRQDPPRTGRRRRLGEPDGPRHGSDSPAPESGPYVPDPAPTKRELMRSAFADHMRHIGRIPRDDRLHRAGCGAGCAAARASSRRS